MAAQHVSIDTILIPGMMYLDVSEAFDKLSNLCTEMRESEELCRHLLSRLLFLRAELGVNEHTVTTVWKVGFLSTVGKMLRLLTKYAAKKVLQRIASQSIFLADIRELHEETDHCFSKTGLSSAIDTTKWELDWDQGIATRDRLLEDLPTKRVQVTEGLSLSGVQETMAELQCEILHEETQHSTAFVALLKKVVDVVMQESEVGEIGYIPTWFIRRDDVEIGAELDMGELGTVHKGRYRKTSANVAVKLLFMDSPETQSSLVKETEIWSRLDYLHVLKLFGACHLGKPYFFVSELATNGNFAEFFWRSENMSKLWGLFHQAAMGLAYIHGQRVIHGNLKCNNILVGNDGNAKLCDFGFSYIRTLEVGKSISEQSSSLRWKAPECLLEQGPDANPSFQSDVFSLGMSIIEAKIGGVPWGVVDDDCIIEQLADGEGYPRPDGVFTDKEWNLIRSMTAFEPVDRISLLQVIETLDELATDQEAEEKCTRQVIQELAIAKHKELELVEAKPMATIQCPTCLKKTASSKFCGEYGAPFCVGIQPLKRLEIAAISNSFNEKRARDAYEGTPIQQNQPTAEANIPQQQLAKDILVIDSDHNEHRDEDSSPLDHVGEQDKHEATTDASDDRSALLNRIKELEKQLGIQNYPGYEELTGRFCNSCGDLNPIDNFFCSECGDDIGVIRRNKL